MEKTSKNPNHPKKGSCITVEPFRDYSDIKSIQKLLSNKPRDQLLFIIGINTGIRTGDLLQLNVGSVRNLKVSDSLSIIEGKTGKRNTLVINKAVHKAIKNYLNHQHHEDCDFLFKSRKGRKALTIQAVNNMVKSWAKAINLRGNYGAHSLRKTWGYIQRVKFGVGFEIIAKRFNHSNPAVTMRYLGIEDKEIHSTLMNEI